jgi:hypothetical protein
LAAAVARIEHRAQHSDSILRKKLFEDGVIILSNAEEKPQWLASIAHNSE